MPPLRSSSLVQLASIALLLCLMSSASVSASAAAAAAAAAAPGASSSISAVNAPTTPLRVVTVNVLFEAFYKKYAKTNTTYPAAERMAAFQLALTQPPLSTTDVICFQEFSQEQALLVNRAGFNVYLSHASRPGGGSAHVATALRRSAFLHPPLEITHVPLETAGSKALLLVLAVHARSGRPLLVANAHVQWSAQRTDYHKHFRVMADVVLSAPGGPPAVLCGDFNTAHTTFTQALVTASCAENAGGGGDAAACGSNSVAAASSRTGPVPAQPPLPLLNAVADVPFTSLSSHNTPLIIDHVWYFEGGGAAGGASAVPALTRRPFATSPSIVVPATPDEMVRHAPAAASGGQAGAAGAHTPDFQTYFSDHAIVCADFELRAVQGWPVRGAQLAAAVAAEAQHLARTVSLVHDLTV